MVRQSNAHDSYLWAFCDVTPTPESSLGDFLDSATSLAQEREISRVHMFAIESLRITLFERHVAATGDRFEDEKAIARLQRMQDRLFARWVVTDGRVSKPGLPNKVVRTRKENPVQILLRQADVDYPAHDGPQVVVASSIVPSSKAGHKTPTDSTELSLLIDEDSTIAQLLRRRNEILEDSANIVGRYRLPRADYDPRRALEIPFMHASFSGERERDDYIAKLTVETPVTGLGIEHMKHGLEISPSQD